MRAVEVCILLLAFLSLLGDSWAGRQLLFVCLPWRGHVNALRAVARTLATRGFAITFALPDEYSHWIAGDGFEFVATGPAAHISRYIEQSWLRTLRNSTYALTNPPPPLQSTATATTTPSGTGTGAGSGSGAASARAASNSAASDSALATVPTLQPLNTNTLSHNAAVHALSHTLSSYQRAMIGGLTRHILSRGRPHLMIIDRFTFAGFDVAHAFNVSYVVNNPHLLLDIDEPPNYFPAPYCYSAQPQAPAPAPVSASSASSAAAPTSAAASSAAGFTPARSSLWERLWNMLQRFAVRIAMLPAWRDINLSRQNTTHVLMLAVAENAAAAAAHSHRAVTPAAAQSQAPISDDDASAETDGSTADDSAGSGASPAYTPGAGGGGGASGPVLPPLSSLRDLHAQHIVLTNTVFGLEHTRPTLLPRFRMTGPLLPSTPEALQPILQSWLDEAATSNQDVFFVNLGDDALLEAGQMNNLLTGLLLKKNVRLLWVLPAGKRYREWLPDSLPGVVRVISYVSQLSVLSHPAVKVAVMHATLTSAQEALYHAKPVILIPFYGDQFEVASRVLHSGVGLMLLPNETHSVRTISLAVHQLIANKTFVNGALRISHILRAAGGTRDAATVIELIAKIGSGFLLTPNQPTLMAGGGAVDRRAYAHGHASAHPIGLATLSSAVSTTVTALYVRIHTVFVYAHYHMWDVYAVYITVLGLMALGVRQCWTTLNALVGPFPLPGTGAGGVSGGGGGPNGTVPGTASIPGGGLGAGSGLSHANNLPPHLSAGSNASGHHHAPSHRYS